MQFDTLTPFEGNYFYRTGCFSRQGQYLSLVDINDLKKQTTLNAWFAQVYALADGKHSVGELYQALVKNYTKAPENLRQTLVSVLYRMVDGKLIKFCDEPVTLPYHVSEALNELDITKACESYQETVEPEPNCDFQI